LDEGINHTAGLKQPPRADYHRASRGQTNRFFSIVVTKVVFNLIASQPSPNQCRHTDVANVRMDAGPPRRKTMPGRFVKCVAAASVAGSCWLMGISGASAKCDVPHIRTLPDQTVDGFMSLRAGERCSIKMTSSLGPTESAEIVQRPANGTVAVDGRNRIVYRPRSGFTGSDTFTYARKGLTPRGVPATRTVRIAVTVTP
jgi:Big-like domain-containing protein